MKDFFKNYLYDKQILVTKREDEAPSYASAVYAIARKFAIAITSGEKYADIDIMKYIAERETVFVADPFYVGFPESVKKLSREEYVLDQLIHYITTYGLGDFRTPGHSIFESDIKRGLFGEHVDPRLFIILTEEEAELELKKIAESLATSTRPLSISQFDYLAEYITEYGELEIEIKSKNTSIRLASRFLDTDYLKDLKLSDLPALVSVVQFNANGRDNIRKLSLPNKARVFVSKFIDMMTESGRVDIRACYEKKQIIAGILHHIHYKPKCEAAIEFVNAMRGKGNQSAWSDFEAKMAEGDIIGAVDSLKKSKGSSAILRNLNYIVSRCKSDEEIEAVVNSIETKNVPLLIQLLLSYGSYKTAKSNRTFKFSRNQRLIKHLETDKEKSERKSDLSRDTVYALSKFIKKKLGSVLSGRLGKVFIDPDMKKIALPIAESTSMGGAGTLPRGSRIPIDAMNKKLRAFVYWSEVNDVDLSATAFGGMGRHIADFYWSTMYGHNNNGIVFSGDQTSGAEGGSEYFDVEINEFKKYYPDARYLVFAATVYSGIFFDAFPCRAGYMIRDIEDSGEVFEPKTVKSSFDISAESTNCYLFALDLKESEFIWLNIVDKSERIVACTDDFSYLLTYFKASKLINMYDFFSMLSTSLVKDPKNADVIVSDKAEHQLEGYEIIRSTDTEKIMGFIG